MMDERRLHQLEAQVDALRTKEKDSEARKTYDPDNRLLNDYFQGLLAD